MSTRSFLGLKPESSFSFSKDKLQRADNLIKKEIYKSSNPLLTSANCMLEVKAVNCSFYKLCINATFSHQKLCKYA